MEDLARGRIERQPGDLEISDEDLNSVGSKLQDSVNNSEEIVEGKYFRLPSISDPEQLGNIYVK